jgi:hypothetical protein
LMVMLGLTASISLVGSDGVVRSSGGECISRPRQEQVWKGQRLLAKNDPSRDLGRLQRPHSPHLNRGKARKLGVICQRPGNGGSRKTAWWGWEDSNCVPGTQSYRTGLCKAASGLARRFARSRTTTCTPGMRNGSF